MRAHHLPNSVKSGPIVEFCAARTVRIVLADHEPFFLQGLRSVLEKSRSSEVVGQALAGRELLALLAANKPDLLILGFVLQCGRDVLALVPDLRQHLPQMIVLLPGSSALFTSRLVGAGIGGILSRQSPVESLLLAMKKVLAGENYIDPYLSNAASPAEILPAKFSSSLLSAREREIYRLLGLEKTRAEIAGLLCISPKTVESHRENIKSKLQITSVRELALAARSYVSRESGEVRVL